MINYKNIIGKCLKIKLKISEGAIIIFEGEAKSNKIFFVMTFPKF